MGMEERVNQLGQENEAVVECESVFEQVGLVK